MERSDPSESLLVADAEGNFYRIPRALAEQHAAARDEVSRLIAEADEAVRAGSGVAPELREAWLKVRGEEPEVEGQSMLETVGVAAQIVSLGMIAWRIHLQKETLERLKELSEFK